MKVIEELEERFSEEQVEEMLKVVSSLPSNDAKETEDMTESK